MTDYRVLKRPEWPFMSADAVMRQIDPNTQDFCALDLCQGYQQVPIAEEHKDMTTFSLPLGRFRYEVLPMGLKPSGDKFNMESDYANRSKVCCLKNVDYVLQQAESYIQLKTRLISLFTEFRDKNIKVKSTKFRLGTVVKFGGFIAWVSENGVYLEPDHE